MATSALIGVLFLAFVVLFFMSALRDYGKARGENRPARRPRLRIGIIFTIVGLGLQFVYRCAAPEGAETSV